MPPTIPVRKTPLVLLVAASALLTACDRPFLPDRDFPDVSSAAASGKIENVRRVLAKGKNPNLKDAYGDYAIIRAAQMNDTGMVRLLLEKGAHPNVFSANGATALLYAVMNENEEMTKTLLQHGALPDHKKPGGTSALDAAREMQNPQILHLVTDTTLRPTDRRWIHYEVTLIDRNHDGLADKKRFHAPAAYDADYDLLDTDYDGTYDQKIAYGYALIKTRVEIPAEPMPGK